MENKHTKGPWCYSSDVVDRGFYIETVDKSHQNTFIGTIGGGLQSKAEIKSNAALISAAPDLLEAAKAALQFFVSTGRVNLAVVELLQSAIEDAEGSTNQSSESAPKKEYEQSEQIAEWERKAGLWDHLRNRIAKFYENDDDDCEPEGDLCDIGEIAATELGFLNYGD